MSLRKLLLTALLPALLLGSGCASRSEADKFNARHASVLKDLLAVAPQCSKPNDFIGPVCEAAAEILTYENPKTSTNRFISLVDEQNDPPAHVFLRSHYRGMQMEHVRAIAIPALLKKYDQVVSDYTKEMRPMVIAANLDSQGAWQIFKQEHTALLSKLGAN